MKDLDRRAEAGRSLRKLREECKLTPGREAQMTNEIAEHENDPRFRVSRPYVYDIEEGRCLPSAYKLDALASVLGQDVLELLKLYGPLHEAGGKLFTSWLCPNASKIVIDVEEARRVIAAVAARFRGETTVVLTPAQEREVIPALWIEMLEGMGRFAVIARRDYTMGRLLSANCFVVIDTGQKILEEGPWEKEEDRPIYLACRNKGNYHVCCWAYQIGNKLTLLPYMAYSGQPAELYTTPTEAEIIGRVIHAWHLPRGASPAARVPGQYAKGAHERR